MKVLEQSLGKWPHEERGNLTIRNGAVIIVEDFDEGMSVKKIKKNLNVNRSLVMYFVLNVQIYLHLNETTKK